MATTIPPINPINLETFLGTPARIPGGLENGNILPGYMNGPAFTPRSQQQASIEALNRALTGDLSASLSGGDRLLALAALMRSATRSGQRAGLTPQQVIGDLRQQQVQQAQARLQIEQLRAAEAQRQQQIAAARQFAETLPEEQRQVFLGLPLEQQMSRMDTQAFRQQQVMFRDRDPATGNMRLTMASGDVVVTNQPMPPNGEWQPMEINGRQEQVWMDKDTGRPLRDETGQLITFYAGVAPNTQATIAAANTRFYAGLARGGSGGGSGGAGNIEVVPYRLSNGGVVRARGEDLGNGLFRIVEGPQRGAVVFKATASSARAGSANPSTRTAPPANTP